MKKPKSIFGFLILISLAIVFLVMSIFLKSYIQIAIENNNLQILNLMSNTTDNTEKLDDEDNDSNMSEEIAECLENTTENTNNFTINKIDKTSGKALEGVKFEITKINEKYEKMWKGEGTQENPYQISTLEDFKLLLTTIKNADTSEKTPIYEDTYFVQTNNIVWDDEEISGLGINDYNGIHYDGAGHDIENIKISGENASIFGNIINGEICNLGIKGGTITSTGKITATFARRMENSILSNSYSTVTINATEITNSVQGLVGYMDQTGLIENSYFAGTIDTTKPIYAITYCARTNVADPSNYNIKNCYWIDTYQDGVNAAIKAYLKKSSAKSLEFISSDSMVNLLNSYNPDIYWELKDNETYPSLKNDKFDNFEKIELTTDEKGQISLNLLCGKYAITELETLDGYIQPDESQYKQTIEITNQNEKIELTIENERIQDLKYTVHYFYDGIEDKSEKVEGTAEFGSKITTYTDKIKKGYVLEKTENLPLRITTNIKSNVINIYYKTANYNLIINKIDKTTQEPLEGVTFEISKIEENNGNLWKGSGTEEDPYQINTLDDFKLLLTTVKNAETTEDSPIYSNTYFVQTNNIVWDDEELSALGTTDYNGIHYDGAGHDIENIKLTGDNASIFGNVINGEICNLGIKGGTINSTGKHTGTFARRLKNSTLSNSYSTATINASSITTSAQGLVGYMDKTGLIENSYFAGTINTSKPIYAITYCQKVNIADPENYSIKNCYWINTYNGVNSEIEAYTVDSSAQTATVMSSEDMVDLLNSYNPEILWDLKDGDKYPSLIGKNIENFETITTTTDEYGRISLIVPIGKYAITEIETLSGYVQPTEENKSQTVEITEKNKVKSITIENERRSDLSYTVHYFYNGVEDKSKRETYTAEFGTKITTYDDKIIDGYTLEKSENLPLIVSTDEQNNQINIYYREVYSITTNVISHTEKYKDGTIKQNVKGGTITGESDSPYENVYIDESNQKAITITPSKTSSAEYEIVRITINDKEIDYESLINKNGVVTIPANYFKNIQEDKHIEVEFRRKTTITIKFLEEDTENELASTEKIIGYESKDFETNKAVIPYYQDSTLGITDENKKQIKSSGTMFADDIIIIYWYKKIPSGVIERHIEINEKGETNELENNLISGNVSETIETKRKQYDGYISVSGKDNSDSHIIVAKKDEDKKSVVLQEEQVLEVWYYYEKQYEITTSVKEHTEIIDGVETKIDGGTISKEYEVDKNGNKVEVAYEKILDSGSNTKEIIMKPESGYRIKAVTINGIDISIENQTTNNGAFIIPAKYFYDVTENKNIVVEFEKITAKVIVNYIEKSTGNKIAIQEVLTGEIESNYKVEEKIIGGYELIEEEYPENSEGIFSEDDIIVNYYYKALPFNIKLENQISRITINGQEQKIENSKEHTITVDEKDLNETEIEITYTIKIENTGTVSGIATITSNIPTGMELVSCDSYWKAKDGKLVLTTDLLEPSEYAEYEIKVRWKQDIQNRGEFENIVNITSVENKFDIEDTVKEDNKDSSKIIIKVKYADKVDQVVNDTKDPNDEMEEDIKDNVDEIISNAKDNVEDIIDNEKDDTKNVKEEVSKNLPKTGDNIDTYVLILIVSGLCMLFIKKSNYTKGKHLK